MITPQMMYSYAKNRIETVEVEGSKKIYFVGESFKAWLTDYVNNTTSSGRQDYNKLAAQYMVGVEVEEDVKATGKFLDSLEKDDESVTDRQMEASVADAE